MSEREVVEDLVLLLRGFFATPAISSLGRLGVLEEMRISPNFHAASFSVVKNQKLFQDTLNYFARLGLIEPINTEMKLFKTTKLGVDVFRRANSFYVPHSYFDYLYKFHEMIQNQEDVVVPEVERLENVIGSGITHLRYFPPAVSFLKRKANFDTLVDIGCGDGHFLSSFVAQVPDKKIIGIDMSEVSTNATYVNLKRDFPKVNLKTFCCDGSDVSKWSKEVLEYSGNNSVAIAMWFLIQEISKNNPKVIIKFLSEVRSIFPHAPIVIGEMVRQSEEILLKNRHRSLIPEYLFFHEMSNQGVLSWSEYKEILAETGYRIEVEKLFDEVVDSNGENIPSTFVWCLVPKES